VAQICRDFNLRTVWYRLDPSDADFITFIQYLIAGLRQYHKDLGVRTIETIKETENVGIKKGRILAALVNEIDRFVDQDITIVLDDFHLVQGQNDIANILDFLFEHLTPFVHLILVSRTDPELNMSKLMARRKAFQITEKDLVFSTREIEALYRELFGFSLGQKYLQRLHEITAGWVVGLILFNYELKDKSPLEINSQLKKMIGTQKLVFSYLEDNVFNKLAGPVQQFLLQTSILDHMDVEFCDEVLKINNSKSILQELESNHLFTFPFDDRRRSYYYHHLFRDFLAAKLLSSKKRKSVLELHGRIAAIFEKKGRPEEALHHYILAGNHKKSAILLSTLSRSMIGEGKLNLFLSFFHRIPDVHVKDAPWIVYYYGRALELTGKIAAAIEAYERSHDLFKTISSQKGMMLSSNRIFSNYYILGDFVKAERELKDFLPMAEKTHYRYIDALGHLIFITSHIGKMDEADQYFKLASGALNDSVKANLHAWIYLNYGFRFFASGNMAEALRFGEKSLRMCQRLELYVLLTDCYNLISISNYCAGNFSRGYEAALAGLRLCEEKGIRESTHAWLLIDACLCAASIGKIDDAISHGNKGLQICREIESLWSEAWAHHALSLAYELSGDLNAAEIAAREAADALRFLKLPLDKGVVKSGLAAILIKKGQLEEAKALLTESEKLLHNSSLNLSRALIVHARCLHESDKNVALIKLNQALSLCREINNTTWVVPEKSWILPLLVDLYSKGEKKNYIIKLIMKFGLEAYYQLREIEKGSSLAKSAVTKIFEEVNKAPAAGLRVYSFGRFKLYRGNDEIIPRYWSSEKAKILFKYLVLHRRNGFVAKDRLVEMLWPEEDPAKSTNRFHVALSALRKTLEPELLTGFPSAYIVRKKDAYRLDLKEEGYCDIKEFEKALRMAIKESSPEESFNYFVKAESVYASGLFDEDRYIGWCIEARDEYRQKYLGVLARLIDFYEKELEYHRCIDLARRYLTIDEYAEGIYLKLMKLYVKVGNTPMAVKVFDNCVATIQQDLDCPLGDDILQYHDRLISGD
jgi:ATP/maltotriose-dependent transcriptional regulator MalT/DNA-binding SARP family transcriptional activator